MAKAVYLITRLLDEDASEADTSSTSVDPTTSLAKEDNDCLSSTNQNIASECKNGDKCSDNPEDVQTHKDFDWDDSTEYLKIALKGLVSLRVTKMQIVTLFSNYSLRLFYRRKNKLIKVKAKCQSKAMIKL